MPYTYPQPYNVVAIGGAGLSFRVEDAAATVLATFVAHSSGVGAVSLTVSDTVPTELYFVRQSDNVRVANVVFNPHAVTKLQIAAVAEAVWLATGRTLTTFGTLVADVATACASAVWTAPSRVLTAFSFTVALSSTSRDEVKSGLSTHNAMDVWNVSQNATFLPNTMGSKFKLWLLDSLGRIFLSRDENVLGALETTNLRAGLSRTGDAMTLTPETIVEVANEVERQIIDEADPEKVTTAIVDKINAANPSLSGLTLQAIASQVRTELAVELGRISVNLNTLATPAQITAAQASLSAAIAALGAPQQAGQAVTLPAGVAQESTLNGMKGAGWAGESLKVIYDQVLLRLLTSAYVAPSNAAILAAIDTRAKPADVQPQITVNPPAVTLPAPIVNVPTAPFEAGLTQVLGAVQERPTLTEMNAGLNINAVVDAEDLADELAPLLNVGDPTDWPEVKAKLLAIGAARVTVQAPVLESGEMPLTRGDAYRAIDTRALIFPFTGGLIQAVAPRLATVALIIEDAPWTQLGTATPTEDGLLCRFELSAIQTQALTSGSRKYWVKAVTTAGDPFDLAEGTATIRNGS